MALQPKLAENIIVGVLFHTDWIWYVSPPWLWILDLERYDKNQGFEKFGAELGTISYQRPITIVNTETAMDFFTYMHEYTVSLDYLSKFVETRVPIERLASFTKEEHKQIFESVLELFPSLVVNFDQQVLYTSYAEPMHISFERHLPAGWKGYIGKTLSNVPEKSRYWIIGGIDYFSMLKSKIS